MLTLLSCVRDGLFESNQTWLMILAVNEKAGVSFEEALEAFYGVHPLHWGVLNLGAFTVFQLRHVHSCAGRYAAYLYSVL